jgi:alpha-tubulin suppressor-like RCC1 family protein
MWGQAEGGILAGSRHVFDMISCGGLHTLAIREGVVYSWGRGEGGQLGHPLSVLNQKKKEETTEFFIDSPTAIRSIPGSAIKVACGDAHSLVLTSEGKVFVFGFCYQGQLGLGLTGDNETFQVF